MTNDTAFGVVVFDSNNRNKFFPCERRTSYSPEHRCHLLPEQSVLTLHITSASLPGDSYNSTSKRKVLVAPARWNKSTGQAWGDGDTLHIPSWTLVCSLLLGHGIGGRHAEQCFPGRTKSTSAENREVSGTPNSQAESPSPCLRCARARVRWG